MIFLGTLLYIFNVFVQPQLFIPFVIGWHVDRIVLSFVAILLFFRVIIKRKLLFWDMHQSILMVLFWIVILISTFSVGWMTYTFNTFIEWGKVVLIYFIIVNAVNSQRKLEAAIWMVVLSSSITAFLSILQHFGIDFYGTGLLQGRIRGVGIFMMNQLAHVLVFVTPLVMALFFKTKRMLLRLILLIILSIYSTAIYLTFSRAGLIAELAVFVLLISYFVKKRPIKIISFGVILVLLIFLWQLAPRLNTVSEYRTEASAKGRLDVWGQALTVLKDFPFFGVGKEQFQEHCFIAPHNSFIQSVTELGLIGLFIWLSFFYYSLKNLRLMLINEKSLTENQKIFSKCFQISLWGYLISSFSSGSAYYETLYIVIALIVALQYLTGFRISGNNRIFSFRDVLYIGLTEIAIIAGIHFVCIF
jgi:putative inorganic carbon (hco3(-)) transporter